MPERLVLPSGRDWLYALSFLHSSVRILQGDEAGLSEVVAATGRAEVLKMAETTAMYAEVLKAGADILQDAAERLSAALKASEPG